MPLWHFYGAAVDQLKLLYETALDRDFETAMAPAESLLDCMREDVSPGRQYPMVDGSDFSTPAMEL